VTQIEVLAKIKFGWRPTTCDLTHLNSKVLVLDLQLQGGD